MIASWIAYGLVVTLLLAIVARLLDRIAELRSWPRRWIWSGALLVAVAFTVAVTWRRSPPAMNEVAPRSIAPAPIIAAAQPDLATATLRTAAGVDLSAMLGDALATLQRFDTGLLILWSTGSVVLLLTYGAGWWTLRRRRRDWRSITIDGAALLVARHDGPAVAGVLRSQIVLPEWALALDTESRTLMIAHEAEHVAARDPLLLQVAIFTLVAMPWNVAAWWIVRRLRLAVELDCDARVLASVVTPAPRYGELLLTVAQHRSPEFFQIAPAFLGHAASLSRRIIAMHPRQFRLPRLQAALAASVAVALLILGAGIPAPQLEAQIARTPAEQRFQRSTPQSDPASPLSGFWIRKSIECISPGNRCAAIATGNRSWGTKLAIEPRNTFVLVTGPEIAFVQHVDTFRIDGKVNRWMPGRRGFYEDPTSPGSGYGVDAHVSRKLWPGESWSVSLDGGTLVHRYESASNYGAVKIVLTYRRSAG